MIQLQHLCGARPQEVILLCPCEVDTSGELWLYQHSSHKTTHLDRSKVIVLGPKAQEVLRPWLDRVPGQRYTRHNYRVAIQRAGIPAWSPRQLRHTRATMIRQAYGLEAAKAVLGHTDTKITEIDAERDISLAMLVMKEIG